MASLPTPMGILQISDNTNFMYIEMKSHFYGSKNRVIYNDLASRDNARYYHSPVFINFYFNADLHSIS